MKAKILEFFFTGFQWTTWKWFAALGEKAKGSWEKPLAVTSSIVLNEVVSTQSYGRILKKLEEKEAKNDSTLRKNPLLKSTLSNMAAGVTFYFVDSTIANKTNSLQLFWRCVGVFFADSAAHFSVSKIYDKMRRTVVSASPEDLRNAYEAGISAIAYNLSDQLAAYVSESSHIESQAQKDALSSLLILLGTSLALPLSRSLWNLPSYCCSFFRENESNLSKNDFTTKSQSTKRNSHSQQTLHH